MQKGDLHGAKIGLADRRRIFVAINGGRTGFVAVGSYCGHTLRVVVGERGIVHIVNHVRRHGNRRRLIEPPDHAETFRGQIGFYTRGR